MEVAAVPLVGLRGSTGERVGLIHSALRRADGLPAPRGGSGQGLPLCKETVDFLLAGKLSQNSSVPQNTPGGGQRGLMGGGKVENIAGERKTSGNSNLKLRQRVCACRWV